MNWKAHQQNYQRSALYGLPAHHHLMGKQNADRLTECDQQQLPQSIQH
jgi:hypothetical protein